MRGWAWSGAESARDDTGRGHSVIHAQAPRPPGQGGYYGVCVPGGSSAWGPSSAPSPAVCPVPKFREGAPPCARSHLTTGLCRDGVSACLCDVWGPGLPRQCPVSPTGRAPEPQEGCQTGCVYIRTVSSSSQHLVRTGPGFPCDWGLLRAGPRTSLPLAIALPCSRLVGWVPGGESLWKSQRAGQLCPGLGGL